MDDAARLIRYPFETPPDHGTALEVAEGVLWMRLPLPMALDHVNMFALDGGDSWTLIDSGIGSRKCREIVGALLDGPLAGKPVARVLVTHHHPDHIGLAGWFQTEHGAELWTTRTAWLTARMLSLDVEDRPSDQAIAFWVSAGVPPDILEKRKSQRPFNFADAIAPLPLGYRRIQEGERLNIGGRTWRVAIGHGHAPEHATLWSETDNLVIGGDQLLPSISPNLGVYPTEPDADPVADWLDSCARFKTMADPDHFVLPGHKLPFTGLPSRLDQKIENHVSALNRLEAALDTPKTACECFVAIFKREITGDAFGLAMVEAVAHCQHLWHTGRANRDRRADGAWVYSRSS
jgi:glyoxylase-like metal-dependent hydrolase (beta-lactamase superfamily II)